MVFYILQVVIVLFTIALTYPIWKRTKSISFPIGILILYTWTIHGAWFMIHDQLVDSSEERKYTYLFEKMFDVQLDSTYFNTLLLYAIFLITLLLSLRFFLQRPCVNRKRPRPLILSHSRILFVSLASGLGAFAIFGANLRTAIKYSESGYVLSRTDFTDLFTLGQVLMRMALVPLSIAFAASLSGPQALYLRALSFSRAERWRYAVTLILLYSFAASLGNKNELLLSLLAALLFYLVNAPQPRWKFLLILSPLCLAAIAAVDVFRGLPLSEAFAILDPAMFFSALSNLLITNEFFAAHFSMYGALVFNIAPTYGSSIVSFLASVVPRYFWRDRPLDIYHYYADNVGAQYGQGYTIHHATAWYLNFGVLGVFIGAILLAWVWASLYREFLIQRRTRLFSRILFLLAPWTFVAGLPSLVRAGPEGYKGIIVDCLLVPTLALMWSCRIPTRKRAAPSVVDTTPSDMRRRAASTHLTEVTDITPMNGA